MFTASLFTASMKPTIAAMFFSVRTNPSVGRLLMASWPDCFPRTISRYFTSSLRPWPPAGKPACLRPGGPPARGTLADRNRPSEGNPRARNAADR
jgi:hypothetical protein